ncbi:MAG: tetratricopeptide repeat protein [Rhodospirillales bacterium]|nr:tetratricopeptide repeat protein [Rhodospirillales bacterium]
MTPDPADPIAGLQAAVAVHRSGDLAQAERLYRAVLASCPDEPNALHLLGVLERQRGRPDLAVALITQALARAPDLADAHANLGNAWSDLQRFDLAAENYAGALRLGGGGEETQRRLVAALYAGANVHRAARRVTEARLMLRRALDEAPDRMEIIQALLPLCLDDDLLEALDLAARAWRLAPTEATFRTVWDLANRAGQDPARAEAHLAAAPQDPFRLIALGNALRRARRGNEAERRYRAAMALAPDQPFAGMRLGCLLLEQNRCDAADRVFRQIEAVDHGRVQAMQFGSHFFRRLRRRALPPPPQGFTPALCTTDLIVFAACDGVYFERFGSALLASVRRNAGVGCQFHLHVINPPSDLDARMAAWRAALGGPPVVVSTESLDTAGWDADRCRTWYACARFRLLPHLMESYAAPVLMLDTDLLVLRDLNGLLEAAAEGDIALVATERHRQEPWNWFWADVLFFNATNAALACADLVARYIDWHLQEGRAHWFLDQIALTACLVAGFREQVEPRIVTLPPDIHRLQLVCADGADQPPDDCVLFWSAHASTVDLAMTLQMPRYQAYVLPYPPASTPSVAEALPTTESAAAVSEPTAAPVEPVGATSETSAAPAAPTTSPDSLTASASSPAAAPSTGTSAADPDAADVPGPASVSEALAAPMPAPSSLLEVAELAAA